MAFKNNIFIPVVVYLPLPQPVRHGVNASWLEFFSCPDINFRGFSDFDFSQFFSFHSEKVQFSIFDFLKFFSEI